MSRSRRQHCIDACIAFFCGMSFGRRANSLLDGRASNEDKTRTEKQGPLALESLQVHRWEYAGVKHKYAENCNDFSQETHLALHDNRGRSHKEQSLR